MNVHPHPPFTEVSVFFASFGNSRISVNRRFLKGQEHQAKRQGKNSDPFLAKNFRNKGLVNRGWGVT